MTSYTQIRRDFAVVFDLEFTAWEGSMANHWLRPGEFKEVVQIGAVKVDADFTPGEMLDVVVRPRLNPVLSPYLEELTGITNDEVRARGVDFAVAYRAFVDFAGGLPIIAYGRDELVLIDNLRLYGIKNALALPPYINIIPWMGAQGVDVRGLHSCEVGPMAGVPFVGHKHNARDDALSVVSGVGALIARGAAAPQAA
ncbi:MAG: 3'-5' exonuclease [Rhizomicrobium sp.]|jgi:inhibitor of KinA sporulation pathway (predicted exonuclease)